jgi:hypothetical protein
LNLEKALVILDTFLPSKSLSNVQELVFRQTWEGKTYAEIASESDYDDDYIRDVGFRLWKMLSAELGEKVTKCNVQSVMRHYGYNYSEQNQDSPRAIAPKGDRSWYFLDCYQTRWVGREALIQQLTEKLQAECRILSLVGIAGIGKSSLAARLALELKEAVETAVTQTKSAYADYGKRAVLPIKVVSFDAEPPKFATVAQCLLGKEVIQNERWQTQPHLLVNAAIEYLQSQPCLLILDMVEEILETGHAGEQRFQDPALAEFCDRLVKTDTMPSRVILTSQERPPTIAQGRYLERSHLQRLSGLSEPEALALFEIWDIRANSAIKRSYLQRIARAYEGHPLALRVIAGEILEPPFNGKVTAY